MASPCFAYGAGTPGTIIPLPKAPTQKAELHTADRVNTSTAAAVTSVTLLALRSRKHARNSATAFDVDFWEYSLQSIPNHPRHQFRTPGFV